MVRSYVKDATVKGTYLYPLEWTEEVMSHEGNHGFVKLIRSNELDKLIRRRPTVFLLLTIIAIRARRTNQRSFDSLEIGEAFIGDHDAYRATQRVYRNDKKFLQKFGLATFKTTNRGTIAKIVDASIFDINIENTTSRTTSYCHPKDEQPTSNKNGKNENNANKKYLLQKNRNPILNDQKFIELCELRERDDDSGVRAKMSLEATLNSRYPSWKYKQEWEEANAYEKEVSK